MNLRINDLFCGAGGMGLGFKMAGYRTAGAWDFDKYAVMSYGENVSPKVKQMDIADLTWQDMPEADVWAAGFPCQDVSKAGRRAGLIHGSRSNNFFQWMRLIDETKEHAPERLPSILLAENVKGLKTYLPIVIEEFEKRGYYTSFIVYNTKFFGLPQQRERYFIIGVHERIKAPFIFMEQQTSSIPKLEDFLETNVPEKYYVKDESIFSVIERLQTCFKVKECTKKGHAIAHAYDCINVYYPNSKNRRGRVGKNLAHCICCDNHQYVIAVPDSKTPGHLVLRKFTPREAARLQGFPDSYKILVSPTQFYKQMGNAVSVPVAKAVAEQIKEFLESVADEQ